jgi:hypothetical protein
MQGTSNAITLVWLGHSHYGLRYALLGITIAARYKGLTACRHMKSRLGKSSAATAFLAPQDCRATKIGSLPAQQGGMRTMVALHALPHILMKGIVLR